MAMVNERECVLSFQFQISDIEHVREIKYSFCKEELTACLQAILCKSYA